MLRNSTSKKTLLIAGFAVGAATAFSPMAGAEPPCDNTGSATVCETPGNTNVITDTPGNPNGPGPQNGAYGPSGDTPPVGNH
jgi:hypothetical protein